jgi:hypothetical protein
VGSLTFQTPSADHVQFEAMCAEVDEFEPLPAVAGGFLEYDAEDGEEDTGLDEQILAALVTPVY